MKQIDPQVLQLLEKEQKVTIGLSTGKDSLAAALVLKKLKIEFIPFFFYHCPDLNFVEKNLIHCEDILEVKIIRMPHPMLYDYLRHQDFQPPKMIYKLAAAGFIKSHFEDMINIYLDSIGDMRNYYDVVGTRASESFNRRMQFKKQGFVTGRKISLIADWKSSDVIEFLKDEKVPLTDDYKIWNRSFDGLKYQFLFGVKENYPDDWQKIKDLFPLIEVELFRYEQNQKYYV